MTFVYILFGVIVALTLLSLLFGKKVPGKLEEWRAEPEAAENPHDVVFVTKSDRKIETIKAIRLATGLGLYEAKCAYESPDGVIVSGVGEARARELVVGLSEHGVDAEIRPRVQGPIL